MGQDRRTPGEERFARAALRAFSRAGYFGTTMAQIAGEAQVSQPRVSQVFGGKLNAYLRAHALAMDLLADELTLVSATSGRQYDPGAVDVVLRHLAMTDPAVLSFLLHVITQNSAPQPAVARLARRTVAVLAEQLADVLGATPSQARDAVTGIIVTLVRFSLDLDALDALDPGGPESDASEVATQVSA